MKRAEEGADGLGSPRRVIIGSAIVRHVFAGTPATALPALQRLIASPRHDVVAVLTRPDAVSGRGGKVTPSPVARLARDEGVEVLAPQRPNSAEFVERLGSLAPEC